MTKRLLCLAAVACCAMGIVYATLAQGEVAPAGRKVSKEAQILLDAAHAAYTAVEADYDVRSTPSIDVEDLYMWSSRWMRAAVGAAAKSDDRIVAYRDHRDRMKKLHDSAEKLNQVGAVGGEMHRLHSTKFYLAEAEAWLRVEVDSERN